MTPSSTQIPPDHLQLGCLAVWLLNWHRTLDAGYVIGIIKTDLAELDCMSPEMWIRPGERAPGGWHVYQAALCWGHGDG